MLPLIEDFSRFNAHPKRKRVLPFGKRQWADARVERATLGRKDRSSGKHECAARGRLLAGVLRKYPLKVCGGRELRAETNNEVQVIPKPKDAARLLVVIIGPKATHGNRSVLSVAATVPASGVLAFRM